MLNPRNRYNRRSVSLVTKADEQVVSNSDMRNYLRLDVECDDDLISSFIDSATQMAKEYMRRSILNETLLLRMDGFPYYSHDYDLIRLGRGVHTGSYNYLTGGGNEFNLPYPPIASITSIVTFDRSNNQSTFSASSYELDETGGRVYLNEGVTWPSELRDREAVHVTYVAGYGSDSSNVPSPIIQSIKTHVGKMYDCREACVMPESCKKLLSPYRLYDELGYHG